MGWTLTAIMELCSLRYFPLSPNCLQSWNPETCIKLTSLPLNLGGEVRQGIYPLRHAGAAYGLAGMMREDVKC